VFGRRVWSMIKVIIAGGRDFDDIEGLYEVMDVLYGDIPKVEVVCGMARGADELGAHWAGYAGAPVKKFPADWDKYGKGAGYIRNEHMAQYADVLVAFWDGKSKGTKNMIQKAFDQGLEVHVYRYEAQQ